MLGALQFSSYCLYGALICAIAATVLYAVYSVGLFRLRATAIQTSAGTTVSTGMTAEWIAGAPAIAGAIATYMQRAALLFMLGALGFRTLVSHRGPYGNMYEFSLAFAATICLAYYGLSRLYPMRSLGALAMGCAAAIMLYGITRPASEKAVAGLIPALQSKWIAIHVPIAMLAYGSFAIGFAAGATYLIQSRVQMQRLPTLDVLDEIVYRAAMVRATGYCEGRGRGIVIQVSCETGRWGDVLRRPQLASARVEGEVAHARTLLPVPVLGLDADNSGEFINHHLVRDCGREEITFTRCRPYKKNDQCHVEQKNYSIVRQAIGDDRSEGEIASAALATVYRSPRLFTNFFQPSVQRVSKERDGGKMMKRYDVAQTPYQRMVAAPEVQESVKETLRADYLTLNPAAVRREIAAGQDALWRLTKVRIIGEATTLSE
ncbi:MAG: cytochrome c biogenesis protein [Thermomicrobiales bacterium]